MAICQYNYMYIFGAAALTRPTRPTPDVSPYALRPTQSAPLIYIDNKVSNLLQYFLKKWAKKAPA